MFSPAFDLERGFVPLPLQPLTSHDPCSGLPSRLRLHRICKPLVTPALAYVSCEEETGQGLTTQSLHSGQL
jgi:hypothetical protein